MGRPGIPSWTRRSVRWRRPRTGRPPSRWPPTKRPTGRCPSRCPVPTSAAVLRNGAAEAVAVAVGYGQLAWALRSDPRVRVHDRTNVRTLTPEAIGGPADLTVADLSFISLRLVLPALAACTDGDLVPMV